MSQTQQTTRSKRPVVVLRALHIASCVSALKTSPCASLLRNMGADKVIHALFLCSVNILFLCIGLCLNATVLICFWKSKHLRRKVCYFMVLIVSCCDVAVVLVSHPFIIFLTFKNGPRCIAGTVIKHLQSSLHALSFYALLTMNIERYIAIKYPIYHWTSMTKRKLMRLYLAFLLLVVVMKVLTGTGVSPYQLASSLTFLVLFAIMIPMNIIMYVTSKRVVKQNIEQGKKQDNQNVKIRVTNKDRVQTKCEQLHKIQSDKLHEKCTDLQEECDMSLHEDCPRLNKQCNKSQGKCDNLYEECPKLHGQCNNLHKKCSKVNEECNEIQKKCTKLQDKSNHTQGMRENRTISNISPCILAVVCFTFCTLPGMIFNGVLFSQGKGVFDKNDYKFIKLWVTTLITMNSTFNTMIFFWNNLILCREAKAIVKSFRKHS